MTDPPGAIEGLAARLETLEQRVAALEHGIGSQAAFRKSEPAKVEAQLPNAIPRAGALGVLSVLGKAMLGIGGAYLLRAVTESNLAPRPLVAAVGIAYAILWLVGAARTPARSDFARIAYACTSALILAPMLWELTLHFQVLPPAAAAGALAVFVAVAFAFSWRRSITPILWVANLTAAVLALTLSTAAHSVAPFLALLLLMVLLAELGAERSFARGVPILAAAAADIGVWVQIYIYSSPQITRPEYPVLATPALVAPAVALFLLSGGSTVFSTTLRGKTITAFATLQSTIAFLLAACSLLLFAPSAGAIFLRAACLVLAAGLYAATFVLFDRASQKRNYAVFATWSLALLCAGLWMSLEEPWLAILLGVAALAATVAGAHFHRQALDFHGAVYLLAAASAAGLLGFLAHALAGPLPAAPSLAVVVAAACAVLCYAVTRSRPDEPWPAQILHLLFAALAAACAAAMLIEGSARLLTFSVPLAAHHLAFLRTLVLCALALTLAFAGAHSRRIELTRIGYAVLALLAVKLVTDDLRHGHLEYSAGSIFLVAITLIAAPRVARATSSLKRKSAL